MEGEVVALKKFVALAFSFLIAIHFVVLIFNDGDDDKRFTVEGYLNNIVELGEMATFTDVVYVWTEKEYNTTDSSMEVIQFLDSIRIFFLKVADSIVICVDILVDLFVNLKYIFPWNSHLSPSSSHGGGVGWVGGR